MKSIQTIDMGYAGELDCEIEYDFTPGTRGKMYGPWEDSYPPEPAEVDISKVTYGKYDLTPLLNLAWLEDELYEKLCEDVEKDDYDEDAILSRWEMNREDACVF